MPTEALPQPERVVNVRRRRIVSRAMVLATAAFGVGIVVCTIGAEDVQVGDINLVIAFVIGTAGMGIVGAVLAAKAPESPLGFAYQVAAMFLALTVVTSLYGERGLTDVPSLPFVPFSGLLMQLAFLPLFGATFTAFLLFPDGHPPSARWRPVAWLLWGGIFVAAFGSTFGVETFEFDTGVSMANPYRMGPEGLMTGLNAVGGVATFAGGILAVISVVVRFRHARGEERQQVRWLAWAAGVILACVVAIVVTGVGAPADSTAFEVAFIALVISVFLGLPIATAIAVLRYRLYDLDLVVKKTAIYSIVAIGLTALYLMLLAGTTLAGFGSYPALIVFVLTFSTVRKRARKLADRIVYGKRATPFEVLSEFSERVGETYSIDDVLPRMTHLLAAGTGAREARAWIRQGRTLRSAAVAPADAEPVADVELVADELPAFDEAVRVFPVTHQGELLGAITLTMAANDPMDASKERLAQGVASQAGLALRNVRLVEDLRASRRRIVAAQDERAKALERNIHDGAQQQLVALTVRLRLAEQTAERNPAAVAGMLRELQDATSATLEDLRDLARGIYPPLLADKGLADALESQARKAAVAVHVQHDGIGRYAPDVESTVYFCVLECLNNVVKYAEAPSATVSLAQADGTLTFEVRDDGRGFDAAATTYGTGLQGMADRLDAVGGRLSIRSTPGAGASVRGEIPVEHASAPPA